MSKCNLDYIDKILGAIEVFLFSDGEKTLQNLENHVKRVIPGLNQEFSLETYFVSSVDFKEAFENQAELYGVNITDFIKDIDSVNVKAKSNIAPNFSSNKITDLFHTLPLVRANFESSMNSDILREIIIGKGDSKNYVSTDAEVSNNLASLKDKLFRQIQQFLIKNGLLTTAEQPLYNENNDVIDYNYYRQVMMMLDNYFFSGEKYPLIKTYSNKKGIPNLALDINTNTDLFNAYNAGILLSNFDTVLQEYFSGIIDINYNLFNNLRANLEEGNKYSLKIEGLKTAYWLSDSHAAEGSESAESKITRLLISTIPYLNKNGQDLGLKMEMKDFYLFAALISDFELVYGNILKSIPGTKFRYLNENPREVLM